MNECLDGFIHIGKFRISDQLEHNFNVKITEDKNLIIIWSKV